MMEWKNKGISLYFQVKEYFKEKILSGEWPADYQLTAEPELAESLNVSRATVRQAINELANEGYIERKRGIGTFVTNNYYEGNFIKMCFPSEVGKRHKMISITHENIDDSMMRHFGLPEGTDMYTILRLRYLQGIAKPAMLEKSYVPVEYFPELEKYELDGDTKLYDVLSAEYGVKFTNFTTELQAKLLTEEESKMLDYPTGLPIIMTTRICYSSDGKANVLTRSLFHPKSCKLVIKDSI
jgi:GntR family transcriptional regulator